ncbi:D-tyrosyl-tRNA(Tyr) deacylase [Marinobacterium lacunae]|uniref:D-aminoacyl-tRNA deacylase n=1 Tax=Marinobacterium lacunae TaxID=1232683 RepID=A0A081G0X8_9GAMM|nr:D-aminoacyl-tRNA deacylase [Marinobacterium lacunae]KEA64433.1 D-tyrosyl-tRNA(Tyr) deacylase [Marinobacterium lacunae]MBR9885331.1 D-tyrosyl-tRNA(Tyr) deacylase [Oceanospirillales bacterium]
MKGLIQRVSKASVSVEGNQVSAIEKGILLLLGIEKDDTEQSADKLLHKILNYRIFADSSDRMNLSLLDTGGGLLVVSQFTLVADTRKGMRPGFSKGASPEHGEELYEYFTRQASLQLGNVATGRFGANMQVSLENDGPVTFMLESPPGV